MVTAWHNVRTVMHARVEGYESDSFVLVTACNISVVLQVRCGLLCWFRFVFVAWQVEPIFTDCFLLVAACLISACSISAFCEYVVAHCVCCSDLDVWRDESTQDVRTERDKSHWCHLTSWLRLFLTSVEAGLNCECPSHCSQFLCVFSTAMFLIFDKSQYSECLCGPCPNGNEMKWVGLTCVVSRTLFLRQHLCFESCRHADLLTWPRFWKDKQPLTCYIDKP